MKEINLRVKGMMCNGCENRVKNVLKAIEGVKEVTADYNTGKVYILCSENISLDIFIDTIEDIGYEVEL